MKVRSKVLILLCLLSLAAAWFFWPAGRRSAPVAPATAPVAAANSAASNQVSTASAASTSSTANVTNRLAFRLTNTTKTLGELADVPHAILLQNALLDTDAKLDLNIPKQLSAGKEPGAFIVQARGVIDARFRALLVSAGGQIISYIPNNAYLVRLSAAGASALSGNGLVQAVLPYEPYYKVNPSLLGRAVEEKPLTPGTALTLGLLTTDQAVAEKQLEPLGVKIIGWDQSPFGLVARVLPPKDWTALARSPIVQVMEPSHQRVTADDLSRATLGVAADSQTSSNYLDLTGANVLVAVNDSGVDATHPDLTGRVFGPDLIDKDGHGTHVAGIIAGDGTESTTVMDAQGSLMPAVDGQFRGMAPGASLFSFGYGHSDFAMQTNAAGQGALISNNSWTYGGDFDYDLAAASYDAATRDALPFNTGSQPVLFVFAAGGNRGGNDDGYGGSSDTILSPGTAKNVITVGALEQLRNITNIVTVVNDDGTTNQSAYWQAGTDSDGQVAGYSSRGNVGVGTEGVFGRFKPDVIAPGTFVVSTRSSQWDTNAFLNPTNVSAIPYLSQRVATNGLTYYNVTVPANAVGVNIAITPNKYSNPFPSDLPIYVKQSGYPTTTSYDFMTTKNGVSIPPDGGGSYLQQIQNSGFDFAVGNSTNAPVNYDLTVFIYTTNNVGDLYSVLLGMDDLLGPYYRYDSGTSMSAAGVSGVLALMQDYFTNTLKIAPSPALLKAMLINGSRAVGSYSYAVTNGVNFQGWGLVNLPATLPFTASNAPAIGANSPLFFVDQSPTNALATGDSHTYIVTLNTAGFANYLPLKATLVWTDPCGDPAAAIKLVNNLDLIITNLDTGEVYFGNDISSDVGYNLPWNTNSAPAYDSINNVENILLSPNQELLGSRYSVTVVGRAVNVNAVTAHTNSVVQDYALVVSCGEGEVPDAITSVAEQPPFTNPTGGQLVTVITTTNSPLFNQMAGASSPLLGTNTIPLGTNTVWGTNSQLTVGMTNQWHFYVVTNDGPSADFTNAAFITFQSSTLSIPRMGVNADSVPDATRPEGDIDLYVATGPGASGLTNLDPVVIANCLNGSAGSRSSLGQGGTEFVYYTDSKPDDVYYIGVKSEDRMAAEYAFLPVFTSTPFSSLDANGNQVVNGLLLPTLIPDGTPSHPGVAYVFALAIYPMEVGKVTVNNLDEHQNFGDLFGALTFGTTSVVLNNHAGLGNTYGTLPLVYDDSRNPVAGTRPTDGPGNLVDYRGKSALGPWILNESDNAPGQTGQVSQLSFVIQPHRKLTDGTIVTVPAQGWFVDYVDVPPGYTNLTFNATNLSGAITPALPPLQMYEKVGNEPTAADFDQTAGLTNCLFGTYPTGLDPGNSISVGPPLNAGQYFIGIYNPSLFPATNVYVSATLGIGTDTSDLYTYTTNPATSLNDDAVSGSTIFVGATNPIASVNVGMVVNTERASDLTFTLVSPTGQRVLLMENRGGDSTNDIGHLTYTTNFYPTTSSGGLATTNLSIGPVNNSGTLIINYDMFTQPDRMDVYYDGVDIYSTTSLNPPSGLISGNNTVTIPYGPGVSDHLVIVMNQGGNPSTTDDKWTVTATVVNADVNYLTFTDDTNLANVPIKFAIPPYDLSNPGTNFSFSDFESSTNGNYLAQTNIGDPFGGWTVPTNLVTVTSELNPTNGLFEPVTNVLVFSNNLVSVVTEPSTAQSGSNYLALGLGTITRDLPFTVGRKYQVTYAYRGPGIAGWWRGEGNASDSSDPEVNGNNGALIGRFNFPAGEVGQAFQFEDRGDQFGFAGTNTYVQIPQNPSLDVGKGGGFTVEGWINPTNLTRPQPLVEWLAHVPTNAAVTNLVIEAGPVLNPATGHYYYLLGATNWSASENWAIALNGHLVTLETANEQNWVRDNFANYGGVNHNLWIGLTNNPPATFAWAGGQTNVAYTNWLATQPVNCDGNHRFTAMLGGTNLESGLWELANDAGAVCPATVTTNKTYGVVEVNDIQTNGVQFWISATNTPGTTNLAFASTNGCLYANIVDTNFVTHEIYSAPGLLQSNVYQHVALTYDTNTGVAMLYLNGTNVATNYFGVFVPKTDGDILLGRDMTRSTNNYYCGGKMDEMSVYSRALSAAEIFAIHNISASATNGLTGKFDPSITPALGLAEAQVSLGDNTRTITGDNNQWQIGGFTFTATTNSMPLRITGLEPGILLDSFSITEVPEGTLYYLPEQALAALTGSPAYGNWTLQVWDNRVGAYVTNLSQLVSWQMTFILESNATYAASLAPQTPAGFTVGAGQINYYVVPVPLWAHFATNILVSSTAPVDLLFNQTQPPTGTVLPDYQLLANATAGIGSPVLAANPPSAPPLLPGQTYYLGVRNPGTQPASGTLEVDYDIPGLSNGVPVTDVLTTNASDAVRYYSFAVSSNAYEATFQLLDMTNGNADLVVRKGVPLPTLTSSDYGSFNVSNLDENIYVLTNSSPVPVSPGTWYLGVIRRDAGPVGYTVIAKELDISNAPPAIIDLTNGVPVNFTAGPGAALTNFFRFSPAINHGLTNAAGIRFEVYNQTGDGDLTVQTNALPLAPPFLRTSQNSGRDPELVMVFTNASQTNLLADWYLGVPNKDKTTISYIIVAAVETNAYFPAFPGATGSGGGAVGAGHAGMISTVYHVTSTGDSGPGTLRAAVNGTNRTVIFDITGTINLTSPIVITNSYLTIAGQSAMCGGVTVAGEMTQVKSAHEVIIRNVRFRPGVGVPGDSLQFLNTSNVIADHVSASWSANNLVSVLNSSNVTVQWSIMADSLYRTNNPQQGVGSLLRYGNGALSLHHNLYADNYSGNPQVGDNLNLDFVNNVIYNWGLFPGLSGGTNDLTASPAGVTNRLNYAANYLIAGPDTALFATNYAITNIAFFGGVTNALAANWIFQTNNFMDSDTNRILNGADTQWHMFTNDYTEFQQPFPLIPVPTDEAYQAYEKVLDFAGVNMCQRDPVDADIVWKVRNQTGRLISAPLVSGPIAWWKAEGDASDSAGHNDGILTGGLGFAPGEVGQAFNFKDTNGYVFVPATSQLNVGVGSGFTIEEWIDPTNVSSPRPLLGWGTNAGPNPNVLSGPVFNPATGHYYYLLQTDTWTNSENQAKALGGHLATIDDAAENTWIYNAFSTYGGTNHSLWIGLNNPSHDTNGQSHINNFTWVNGESAAYRNWSPGEPNNYTGNQWYVYVFAPGDPRAGSWDDDDNVGTIGSGPATMSVNGVVESDTAPGTYFWISVSSPGGGGPGCLYANLVDSTNGSHVISSAAGLLANDVYQHVALTYDTNSGVAVLYLNGAAVASKNLGIFVPKTTGDVVLGKRVDGMPVNTFAGGMDEVTIYNRALSAGEIQAIYTAGSAGKFSAGSTMLPYLDTDRDGLPDFWETTFGQNPTNYSSNDSSTNVNFIGYTTLEEYLAWRAGPHALTVTNTPAGVDLYQMFGNTGHLGFSVGNAVNGTVYLTNNVDTNGVVIQSNTLAVFTPTVAAPPYSGYASFDVYVTNADTVAYFGPVTVNVMVSAVPILYESHTNGPVLATNLPDVEVDELSLLTVTNTATEVETNLLLTYELTITIDTNAMIAKGWPLTYVTTNPPPVIDANGVITWTPSEAQGPGIYTLTTIVTDNGIPPLSATNSFDVTVNETNSAPFWPTNTPSQTNYIINALNLLTVTNTAMDSDIPPNPLSYRLFGPPGALIDTNGIITWIPTLAQAPGVYTFTTVVTDTNQYALANKSLSATNTFTVTVPALMAPFVFTQPAQAVTGTSARLNGMATPNGLPSVAWFEWGTSTLYGSNTLPVAVGQGFNVVYTPAPITGLTPNLPYHFRLVVSNAFTVVYGFDQIMDVANVVAWGANYVGQATTQPSLTNAVAIAGAYDHSLALRNNGTVAAWGDNTFGQATVPGGLNNVLAVAGGAYYSMALKNGGTVTAWGANILNQISVPPGLNGVVGIAGGTYSSLALRNNGVIVAWGASFFNLTNVPPGLSNVVAIAGGSYHNLAIRNDGTVAIWGDDSAHQTDLPAGLSNVVAIAGGNYHSLALRYDGTVVAWGDDSAGQTNVPPGLTNVVAVAAGGFHSVALKNDGSIVTWGDDTAGQTDVPPNLTNAVAISSGYFHTLALTPQSIASLTNAIVLNLTNDVPQTGTILGRSVVYYRVNVPLYADFATNSLLYTVNGPLDVWFSTNTPPTIAGTNDSLLFAGATNGVTILSTLSAPTNIVPGTIYYLGINNTNNSPVGYGIEVDFHLTSTNPPPQTNTVPVSDIVYTNIGGTFGFLLTWYASSNELFQVQWSDNLPFNWQTFTNIVSYNTNYPAGGTNATFTFFDDGSQAPFTGSRYYQLILLGSGVPSGNTPPVLPTQTTRTINPLTTLVVTNTATDADVPAQTLTYSLTSTVAGANQPVISPAGVITWTPDLSQAGTSSVFTTIVTDDGTPAMSATNSFTVMVVGASQTNTVPISEVIYTNGNFLLKWTAPSNELFQVQWSDSLPFTWQTFTNIVGYDTNYPASMTNATFTFLDDGSQAMFTGSRYYQLILLGSGGGSSATNTPPALPAQMNRVADPLNPLTVTNTAMDVDVPAQTLSYTLTSTVAGTNKPVISSSGVIMWTPDLSQAGTSNVVTTIVTDNGVPAMSATNSFAVIVNPVPEISSVTYTNGGFWLTWSAPTNDIFQVQFSDSLAPLNWQNFSGLVTYAGPVTPTNGLFSFHDDGVEHPLTGLRFYQINLVGVGLPSAPTGTNTVPIGGIIVTNGKILLTWTAPTNSQFNVLWTTNIANPSAWTPFPGAIISTNGTFNFIDTNAPMLLKFYELLLLP